MTTGTGTETPKVKCSDIPTSTWPAGYKGGGGTLDPLSQAALAGKPASRFRQGAAGMSQRMHPLPSKKS